MAVNLATKYSDKVDERFKLKSLTEAATHQEYDWDGVKTVNIYNISTSAMNDYTRSGTARYGVAAELDDTVTPFTITKDRSFTFTIDQGNKKDSMNVREAGKALARQHDEVVVPEIDTYRLTKWDAAAVANSGVPTATNITTSNAYSSFLQATQYLDDNKVPSEGRIAFCTPAYINKVKQDPAFIKASEIAQNLLIKGQVGEIDGVAIVKVITPYMPAKTPFIIVHKSAMCAPKKLQDYKIHENPPGINGNLVEGRIYYDAFILPSRVKSIYSWKEV
ncbi:P22 phage major capsid protein family protein [Neobacillus sp. WH10]|uniref:P22 phage major capsid protein family protein n=1 Tax=Neobacillus sp. WH10 TaxID=3047873 RepID=UPI0024C1C4A4|nr:P22 phage major capsid protein family protein [Neobacillus sp. WH10]WHY76070.1 P22 phage major capsid protein family protein [Neobacillus sp. WH10]